MTSVHLRSLFISFGFVEARSTLYDVEYFLQEVLKPPLTYQFTLLIVETPVCLDLTLGSRKLTINLVEPGYWRGETWSQRRRRVTLIHRDGIFLYHSLLVRVHNLSRSIRHPRNDERIPSKDLWTLELGPINHPSFNDLLTHGNPSYRSLPENRLQKWTFRFTVLGCPVRVTGLQVFLR